MLLPIADMAEARLVLTDDLIRESLRRGKAAAEARDSNETRANARADNDNRMPETAHANGNEGE